METINELLDYCNSHDIKYVTREQLKALSEGCPFEPELGAENFPMEDDEALTSEAIDLLSEIAASHERKFTDLEKKLIETGVVSGRCYVCWHENKYYPGATVDNLKAMGFSEFYDKFKSNWEEIKNFRKQMYKNK